MILYYSKGNYFRRYHKSILYVSKVSINATKLIKPDASDMRAHHSKEENLSGKICSIKFPPQWKNKKIKREGYIILFKGNQFIFYHYPVLPSQLIICLVFFPSSLNLSSLVLKVNLSTKKPIFCRPCLLSSRCRQVTSPSLSINNLRNTLCLVFIFS